MGRLGGVENFNESSMTDTNEAAGGDVPVSGHVKWFDAAKGFGFVVAETGGPDILLHANVLRNLVTPPETDESNMGFETVVENLDDIALTPARVKWFDKAKGFGFGNAYGESADIFLHIEVLRKCGLADLEAGEAVCLRIVEGERGQMAAEVHAWDYAIQSD